ncbi:MAG: aldehyde dehydrogenase [Firmicutes bacterium]|nr:aldehyde dehydrogenase [Bacillota bacterium]
MLLDEERIAMIVREVVKQLQASDGTTGRAGGEDGIFSDVDAAARAAAVAQRCLVAMSLGQRDKIIRAIRETGEANAQHFARITVDETGLGRYEHKVQKNINAARLSPGMEELGQLVQGDDHGITITRRAPYGVIVSITPTTHPTPFVINHGIIMLAGGNTVFFCPHPRAQRCSREAIQILNRAIVAAGGPPNCLVAVKEATLDVVNAACSHPLVDMVTAAGGPGVVKAALSSGKKAVAAGAANPPVVVDETADIARAAQDIIRGAWFDNNILCIGEKTVFAVDPIAEELVGHMKNHGAYLLSADEATQVTRLIVKDGHIVGDWVGKDGKVILQAAGITPPPSTEGAIMVVPYDHPLVKIEQMLPVLPIVIVSDFAQGLKLALESEQGFGHTAVIHSQDVERISLFTRTMQTTIVVANGPSFASLGIEGASNFAHTIASPTGEGICGPWTFTRQQNLTMAGGLTFA